MSQTLRGYAISDAICRITRFGISEPLEGSR